MARGAGSSNLKTSLVRNGGRGIGSRNSNPGYHLNDSIKDYATGGAKPSHNTSGNPRRGK